MMYGTPPLGIGHFPTFNLSEVMRYLYLPVYMNGELKFPSNLKSTVNLVTVAKEYAQQIGKYYSFIYITAKKGWATPDNPLNRPGWHCDGFGTSDMNFILWVGSGTRFVQGEFTDISDDHIVSMEQFQGLALANPIISQYSERCLYALDPYCIHATPLLTKGEWRQFVKISMSNNKYNLKDNSHNYLFDYKWDMVERDEIRNDPSKAGRDYA